VVDSHNEVQVDLQSPLGALLTETYDLFAKGLIEGADGVMDSRWDSHASMLDIHPRKMRVQGISGWLVDLMELASLPTSELEPLVSLLSA